MDDRRIASWVLVGAVAVLASAAQADTIYVDDDNCPGPGSGTPGDPYCSIQTAIDNAVDTDEITVAPGTYFEMIDFLGRAVTLRSSGGPAVTIIDAQGSGSVVTCGSGEGQDTLLDGFTITGGWQSVGGGGMINSSSSPTVTNCTFSGNSAAFGDGGGMYNFDSNSTVTNCILWGNTPDEIYDVNSITTVSYSDVEGGTGQSWFGTGCIDADPCFADAIGGDLHLLSVSPCIDAGDNNSVPTDTADLDNDGNTAEPIPFDLDGVPRVVDGNDDGSAVVDMGAFEFELPGVHNITQDTCYETIQAAIDDANNGDQIEVAPGTYNEAIIFNGKAVRLYSSGGPDVTIIDGTGYHHVVVCNLSEEANTILEGFTITGGNANDGWGGGGMITYFSSPTVTDCTFSDNSAAAGGGMYNDNSSPDLDTVVFFDNEATNGSGGGMYNTNDSSPTLDGATFDQNTASLDGGGMYNDMNCDPILAYSTFIRNTALRNGGGMYAFEADPELTVVRFESNHADQDGGAMHFNRSYAQLSFVDVVINSDDTRPRKLCAEPTANDRNRA